MEVYQQEFGFSRVIPGICGEAGSDCLASCCALFISIALLVLGLKAQRRDQGSVHLCPADENMQQLEHTGSQYF